MLRMSLRTAGFEVAEVTNGREAMQLLQHQPPEVVVLDLGLPDNAGGQVLQWLRQQEQAVNGGVAWVVISALDQQEVTERHGPLGDRFIPKPFDPWDLVRTLERIGSETRSIKAKRNEP